MGCAGLGFCGDGVGVDEGAALVGVMKQEDGKACLKKLETTWACLSLPVIQDDSRSGISGH